MNWKNTRGGDNNMQDEFKNSNKINEDDEPKKKPHHPTHDIPPHILKELLDLREKVGRLQGQMEVLLKMQK